MRSASLAQSSSEADTASLSTQNSNFSIIPFPATAVTGGGHVVQPTRWFVFEKFAAPPAFYRESKLAYYKCAWVTSALVRQHRVTQVARDLADEILMADDAELIFSFIISIRTFDWNLINSGTYLFPHNQTKRAWFRLVVYKTSHIRFEQTFGGKETNTLEHFIVQVLFGAGIGIIRFFSPYVIMWMWQKKKCISQFYCLKLHMWTICEQEKELFTWISCPYV